MKFLTFDLGTTLFKVALFDDRGNLLAVERAIPPIVHPQPNWAEVRFGSFLHVLCEATGKLKAAVGGEWGDLRAVSFATQANSFMLIGDGGAATQLILWPDRRASALADELAMISMIPGFRQSTGMPRLSPLLALAKVLWFRREQPDVTRNLRQLLFLSDYLTLELTNSAWTEAGVAGLSGALDIRTLRWREDILQRLEVPPIQMPAVARAGTALGTLEPAAAAAFELPRDCRFVVGCLDQYAGAIGTGTVTPGAICETTGTVLAAVRYSHQLAHDPAPDVFQGPSFQSGHFFQMSFSSTSANLLDYYRSRLADAMTFEQLTQEAVQAPPSDLVVHPFRDTPEASFRDVTPDHTPGQVVRAIMQCVAQQLQKQVRDIAGTQLPTEIRSAGGAARNDYWLQMKADTLGIPFVAMECEEPTSLGAAMLAASAVGLGDVQSLAQQWVKVRKRFDPR